MFCLLRVELPNNTSQLLHCILLYNLGYDPRTIPELSIIDFRSFPLDTKPVKETEVRDRIPNER